MTNKDIEKMQDLLNDSLVKIESITTFNNLVSKKLNTIENPTDKITNDSDKESTKVKLYFIQQDIKDYIVLMDNQKQAINDIESKLITINEMLLKEVQNGK